MNIQAMKRAYRNHHFWRDEEKPEVELKKAIKDLDKDFWESQNESFLEKQKDKIVDTNITSEAAVLKIRKEIREIAHSNNLVCSFLSQGDYYYISIKPSQINVEIGKDTGSIAVSQLHFHTKQFFYYEWQSALEWIQDYLAIDTSSLIEKKRTLRKKIFVNYKNGEIAAASIKSLCELQAKKSGLKCTVDSSCLSTFIQFYKEDKNSEIEKGVMASNDAESFYRDLPQNPDGKRGNIIVLAQLRIYHKAFIEDPSFFREFIKNPYKIKIESKVECKTFQSITKTPKEILVGDDNSNMCLSCAIGILNNVSEDYKTEFETSCKRGGLAFEEIHTKENNIIYCFMNLTLDDAKYFFGARKLKTFVFIQKQYSMEKDLFFLDIKLLKWNANEQAFEPSVQQKPRVDDPTSLQSFFKLYNPDLHFPYSFSDLSKIFFQKYSWKTPSRLNEEAYVYLVNAHKYSGSARMRYRCRMYHKPQTWELENGLRNQYYEMWKKEK